MVKGPSSKLKSTPVLDGLIKDRLKVRLPNGCGKCRRVKGCLLKVPTVNRRQYCHGTGSGQQCQLCLKLQVRHDGSRPIHIPGIRTRVKRCYLKAYRAAIQMHMDRTLKKGHCLCARCGVEVPFKKTIQGHTVPACEGGKYTFWNILPTCAACEVVIGSKEWVPSGKARKIQRAVFDLMTAAVPEPDKVINPCPFGKFNRNKYKPALAK